MDGPSTGSSKGNKWVLISLIWLFIFAAIFIVFKYSGRLDSFLEDKKQDKLDNLTEVTKVQKSFKCSNDLYDGYSIIRSKKFKKILRNNSLSMDCKDDGANYSSRWKKLVSGEIDIATMPLHDYLEQLHFSGMNNKNAPVIIGAVSLSIDADAVVAHPKYFKSINDLKGLKKVNSCYTSKFMLGSMAVDTGNSVLLKGHVYEDINETFENLMNGNCKIGALWEPYISMAKKQGFQIFMGSSELKQARIVDVYVVNRESLLNNKEEVYTMLHSYYEAVDYYSQNMSQLYSEIETLEGGGKDSRDVIEISENLSNVKFYTLADNAFTLFKGNTSSEEKILDYIDAITIKLIKMNSIEESPLEGGLASSVIHNKAIQSVYNTYPDGEVKRPPAEAKVYNKIKDTVWKKLIRDPKFSRDDLKITFMRSGLLNKKGKTIVDNFASQQILNFDYYVAIVGKTAKITGLTEEILSKRTKQKADQVHKYLVKYYQINPNRIKSIGAGSSMTRAIRAGESIRNYINDNNTVEIMFIDYK